MQDHTDNKACCECGRRPKLYLTRGRCDTCYRRLLYHEKKALDPNSGQRRPGPVPKPMDQRLLAKVTPGRNGCWVYTGSIGKHGYGFFTVSANERTLAHRISYRLFVGTIPDGRFVDHQCHNRDDTCRSGNPCVHRRCINPDHLELATPKENVRRSPITQGSKNAARTHCPAGHAYTPENTRVRVQNHRTGGTGRECLTCRRVRNASRKAASK